MKWIDQKITIIFTSNYDLITKGHMIFKRQRIFTNVDHPSDTNNIPVDYKWDAIKYTIVRRTIETICDLICTFPKSTTFVPGDKSDNWLESLVGFYIFGTIATDWHLIVDSEVCKNISNALRVMLDGYTKDLWKTTPFNDAESGNKGHKANTDSVSCDIMEAFMIIGRTDDAANLQPWSSDEVHQAIIGDHHDNMFRRLQVRPFFY
jgi:hypothetical protein